MPAILPPSLVEGGINPTRFELQTMNDTWYLNSRNIK
jgi:hypothetical protein